MISIPNSGQHVSLEPSRQSSIRTLLLVLGVSTLLKLILLWPAAKLPLRFDQKQYVAGAIAIAERGVPEYTNPLWDEAHASPVYPYGLAALHLLLGAEGFRLAAQVIQVLLSTLTALFVYLLAARLFGSRNAMLSAGVVAFFPTFIAYTHFFYAETVYTFFFVGLTALLVCGSRPPTMGRALFAGLIGGFAALTRGVFVFQAFLVALWLLFRDDRPGIRRALNAGAFIFGLAIVIAPWSVRNTIRYDRFLLIDTNGGNVLHKNWNAIRQENHDIGMFRRWKEDSLAYSGQVAFRERVEEEHFVDRNTAEISAATRFVLAHPLVFARNSLVRVVELVNPTSFMVRAIRRGEYFDIPAIISELLVLSVLLSTMAVLAFGVLGIAGSVPAGERTLPVLMILGNVAVCVLVVAMSRYRFPLMALLIPFSVDGMLGLGRRTGRRGRAWWVSLAVILFMMISWVFYVPLSL